MKQVLLLLLMGVFGLVGVAQAVVCNGITVTHFMTCNVPADYDDATAQVIEGTSCVDVVDIGENDIICTRDGDDSVYVGTGGTGTAQVWGGNGNDDIICAGQCFVNGGPGADQINCGAAFGNQPTCEINGSSGNDSITCKSNCDASGGTGADLFIISLSNFITANAVTLHGNDNNDVFKFQGISDTTVNLILDGGIASDTATCLTAENNPTTFAAMNVNVVSLVSIETNNCD